MVHMAMLNVKALFDSASEIMVELNSQLSLEARYNCQSLRLPGREWTMASQRTVADTRPADVFDFWFGEGAWGTEKMADPSAFMHKTPLWWGFKVVRWNFKKLSPLKLRLRDDRWQTFARLVSVRTNLRKPSTRLFRPVHSCPPYYQCAELNHRLTVMLLGSSR
jgi:hypothetical protein